MLECNYISIIKVCDFMNIIRYTGRYIRIRKVDDGVVRMAVSMATLGCVTGEVGTRLIKDIKSTSINMEAFKSCESLIKKIRESK